MQELVARHEIQDAFARYTGVQGRGRCELDKSKLRRAVRIGAEGNPAARLFRQREQVRTEILAVRISVDFDGLIQFRRLGKDAGPVRGQSGAIVVDAPARMNQESEATDYAGPRDNGLSDPPCASERNGSSR